MTPIESIALFFTSAEPKVNDVLFYGKAGERCIQTFLRSADAWVTKYLLYCNHQVKPQDMMNAPPGKPVFEIPARGIWFLVFPCFNTPS